jgi:hypothetical protein
LGFRPFQKIVEQFEDSNCAVRIVAFVASEHELMETIMGGIAVWAVIVSATIGSDEPGITVLTKPGL